MANKPNKFAQIFANGVDATLTTLIETTNDRELAATIPFEAFLEEERVLPPKLRAAVLQNTLAQVATKCFSGDIERARAFLNRLDQANQKHAIVKNDEDHETASTKKQAAPAKRPVAAPTPAMTNVQIIEKMVEGFVGLSDDRDIRPEAGQILSRIRRESSMAADAKTRVIKTVSDRLTKNCLALLPESSTPDDMDSAVTETDRWIEARLNPDFQPQKKSARRRRDDVSIDEAKLDGGPVATPTAQPSTLN